MTVFHAKPNGVIYSKNLRLPTVYAQATSGAR